MGNRPDENIDRNVIVKIVKERLIQKGEKQEILNSLIKLSYSKQEAEVIIKEAIKELENAGIFLKSDNNIFYLIIFLIIIVIIVFYYFLK